MSKRKKIIMYILITVGVIVVAAVLGAVCGRLLIDNII